VLFGAIYDWYDPILAIDAAAIARAAVPDITLTFTTHPNPSLTPQGKLAEAMEHARRNQYGFIRFEPWVAYNERAAFFSRFAAALLTFTRSIETDLSMRTRVYDYLWSGLPIVTSSAPGTDEIIVRHGAGVVVKSGAAADYAAAIVRALREPAMRAGTRQFAADHQWSRTLAPLVDFVRAPHSDPHKARFAVSLYPPQPRRSIVQRIRRRIGGVS
jgi:glycosyltransferase involved in cell wall biosynthesis